MAALEKHGNYLTRSSKSRKEFLSSIDLSQTPFEIQYADFGFSKLLTDKNQQSKTVCGTPLYMSPQLVNKTEYTAKADIWSLGIALFEMLNG